LKIAEIAVQFLGLSKNGVAFLHSYRRLESWEETNRDLGHFVRLSAPS
jgi:hypothetical protein